MAMKLYIVKAQYRGGLRVELTFNDNFSRIVDFSPFLKNHPHPQYDKHQDPKHFQEFEIEYGNIVWGKDWDLVFPIQSPYSGNLE